MIGTKYDLLLEYQRLDLEFEAIRKLAERVRSDGHEYAAEDLDAAKQLVYQALLRVKQSWKFIPDQPDCEQIKMEF